MDLAHRTAELSRAVKLKVGCVLVTTDDCIVYGWNGTPTGWDNVCEYKDWDLSRDMTGKFFPNDEYPYYEYSDIADSDGTFPIIGRYRLMTKPEVLHSEMNALSKLAKSTLSGAGASLYLTHSPCIHCAKAVYQAGIKNVYYAEEYRSRAGIEFLHRCGINIQKVEVDITK